MATKIKGVDISEFNGTVDFTALKNAGIEFVIIRTGLGSDYPGQQDDQFEVNVKACEKAGLPYGVYPVSYTHLPITGAALVEEMGAVASQEAIPSGLTIITATLWELCGLTAPC